MYTGSKNKFGNPLSKFVGVYLPLRITNAINLNCLAFGMNKTNFIKYQLTKWMNETWSCDKQSECVLLIALGLKSDFDVLAKTQRSLTYGMFISEVKTELINKGLSSDVVDEILNKFKQIHFNKL